MKHYILIRIIINISTGLTSWFSLVSIPFNLRYRMLVLTALSYFAGYAIEQLARVLFPASLPPEKGGIKQRI